MFVLEYEYGYDDEILFVHDSKEFLEKFIVEVKLVEQDKKNLENVEDQFKEIVRYFTKNNYRANFFKIFEMQSFQEFSKDRLKHP